MGLDTTHGAFHGSYSSFNRFRQAVAKAVGGSFPPHEKGLFDDDGKPLDESQWYIDDSYSATTHPGLRAFLSHSDCDGEFTPKECTRVADELERAFAKA